MSNGDREHSDYIVYVDESGDHGLSRIDPNYPVFVLAFCVFRKADYCDTVVPAIQRMKFEHFGHDQVVLHEREIRKGLGHFAVLNTLQRKDAFITSMTEVITTAPFTLIAAVIDKPKYRSKLGYAENCYHQALQFGLERLWYYLRRSNNHERLTHVVVERRGKREDDLLELEFRRLCDGKTYLKRQLPFDIVVADKLTNSVGMQFADLIARPVGTNFLRPSQTNRAFEAIKPKRSSTKVTVDRCKDTA